MLELPEVQGDPAGACVNLSSGPDDVTERSGLVDEEVFVAPMNARAVSVDLACKKYQDIGVAIMSREASGVRARLHNIALHGKPDPAGLADYLVALCERTGASMLLIDGPQGWKDAENGLPHARVCEKVLATPVKTGLPGCVKPGPFLPFAEFSIEVFDALHALGWERYAGHVPSQARIAAESFPTAAWKSLGLPPLPAKAKCKGSVVRDAARLPVSERGVAFGADPNHDQLQAVVSGLAAIALVQGNFDAISVVGESPTYKDGCWREGFILNPL
jgi:hypothetical protein